MTEYEITFDILLTHEETCEKCIEYNISDEMDISELKCVVGWTLRDKLRLLTEKIENPSNFVA